MLFLAEAMSATVSSEPHNAYKWAEALSRKVELTVLCHHHCIDALGILSEQLPLARVVNWPFPPWPRQFGGFDSQLKLSYTGFFRRARRWIAEARAMDLKFDIAHQITPQAVRYPSPLQGCGIPYVTGPIGGSLPVPEAFRAKLPRPIIGRNTFGYLIDCFMTLGYEPPTEMPSWYWQWHRICTESCPKFQSRDWHT